MAKILISGAFGAEDKACKEFIKCLWESFFRDETYQPMCEGLATPE